MPGLSLAALPLPPPPLFGCGPKEVPTENRPSPAVLRIRGAPPIANVLATGVPTPNIQCVVTEFQCTPGGAEAFPPAGVRVINVLLRGAINHAVSSFAYQLDQIDLRSTDDCAHRQEMHKLVNAVLKRRIGKE
jgi:hypothetical protein